VSACGCVTGLSRLREVPHEHYSRFRYFPVLSQLDHLTREGRRLCRNWPGTPFVLEGRHALMKGGPFRATIIVRLFVGNPTAGEAGGCGPRPSLSRK
jgi:hypothetical protein